MVSAMLIATMGAPRGVLPGTLLCTGGIALEAGGSMATSSIVLETDVPGRYINRLCRHWSHKFEVSFDSTAGEIKLGEALCTLKAAPTALQVTLEASDESLEKLQQAVMDHLQRFAPPGVQLVGS